MSWSPEYELAVVRIFVHDWDEAVTFYTEKLGMPLAERNDSFSWAEVDVGGCHLAIEGLDRSDSEAPSLVGRHTGVSLRVADIDAAHRELVERGVEFVSAPRMQPWGGVLAHLRDPEGNVLTLLGSPA